MNSFLRSKIALTVFFATVLWISCLTCVIVDTSKNIILLFGFSAIISKFILCFHLYTTHRALASIPCYIKQWVKGELYSRFTYISDDPIVADIKWELNNLIDIVDALNREIINSMTSIQKQKFYRKILSSGIQGIYQISASKINDTIHHSYKQRETIKDAGNIFESKIKSAIQHVSDSVRTAKEHSIHLAEFAEKAIDQTSTAETKSNTSLTVIQSLFQAISQLSLEINEINQRVCELESSNIVKTSFEELSGEFYTLKEDIENFSIQKH